ncbi:MAG: methylated-DNA--[protein]-cysteine S-methyltransferase [Candidatus Dormiibacterota bacterium]
MTQKTDPNREIEDRLRRGGRADIDDRRRRAVDRLRQQAETDRLVDIAYATIDSPMGSMLVAATTKGLVSLSLPNQDPDLTLAELAARVSPRILEAPGRLDVVRRQLDEYFEGSRHRFELDLDWQLIRGFHTAVLEQTARIPYGSVSTYREMAIRAGSPLAVRAAGNALATNPIPIVIPCHRVLRTGGGLGGYGGGLDMKAKLLALEGASLRQRGGAATG